jgi:hypothetical protein
VSRRITASRGNGSQKRSIERVIEPVGLLEKRYRRKG